MTKLHSIIFWKKKKSQFITFKYKEKATPVSLNSGNSDQSHF